MSDSQSGINESVELPKFCTAWSLCPALNNNSNFFQPLSGNWADIVEAHEQGLSADVSRATQSVVFISVVCQNHRHSVL